MDKLKMHSPNLVDANIEKISALFPNCITETKDENGELKKAVDFDLLKQELSQVLVEGEQERYRLDWVGKKEAILTANAPIAKTLRPCREESVNFDKTENLFIEGDNLEALKLLQENYLGKVKMIYIDPPYNTGNDFIYEDDFAESTDAFFEKSNQVDEEGNRLIANTDSNGRFHSDWLSMMYSRLKLARTLLKEDGVIFISIDDNEQENLKKICSEVFGENNFISQLVWEKKKKGAFLSGAVTNIKEYIFVYAKKKEMFNGLVGEIASSEETYPVIKTTNTRGKRIIKKGIISKFKEKDYFLKSGTRISSGNMEMIILSDMIIEDGKLKEDLIVDSNWIYSQDLLNKYACEGNLYITQDLYFRRVVTEPRIKKLKDLLPMKGADTTGFGYIHSDNLFLDGWGTNEDGFDEIHYLMGKQSIMSFPKPSKLISKLLVSATRFEKNSIILDFFAGSSTTAHAVMQLNAEDNGNRKFIMVQLPETVEEKSEACKAGYQNIAEISKERIRRAGKKIIEDNASKEGIENLDIGFRVLKIDSTNMKDVYYTPDALKQADMLDLASNIKEDRTSEDLLFQVMLDWGLELSLPIERKTIAGKEVFYVAGNSLVACFDELTFDVVDEVAKDHPLRFISAEKAIHLDHDKTNIKERFKQLSPDTEVKFL